MGLDREPPVVTRKPAGPPKRDRSGYYATPAGRFMSVTTILDNGIPKPALMHWASWEAASCAVDNIPDLVKARGPQARDELRRWIQHAGERKKDAAANLGTAVHGFLEAQILGQPMPELTDEQRPFVDAFARWLDDFQPEFEASELTVANPEHGYAGTLDAIARIPVLPGRLSDWENQPLMIDWKTGKSAYPEVGLQLAAYRRCPVGWTKPAGVQVDVPATVGGMVLHIRPEGLPGGEPGGYAFIPARTDDAVFGKFLAAKETAEGMVKDGLFDSILGEPVAPPVKAEVA